MFYEYHQNNSGGGFAYEEDGVTYLVIIEANSPAEADERAERVGIYFDDEGEIDCECCGSRWNRAYGKGSEVPSVYGTPLWWYENKYGMNWMGDKPDVFIHYKDGTVGSFKFK